MPGSFQRRCTLIFPYLVIPYFIFCTFYFIYLYCPCLWYTPFLSVSFVIISYFSLLSCSTPNWILRLFIPRSHYHSAFFLFLYVCFCSNSLRSSSFASSLNFVVLCPVLILILSLFVSLLVLWTPVYIYPDLMLILSSLSVSFTLPLSLSNSIFLHHMLAHSALVCLIHTM